MLLAQSAPSGSHVRKIFEGDASPVSEQNSENPQDHDSTAQVSDNLEPPSKKAKRHQKETNFDSGSHLADSVRKKYFSRSTLFPPYNFGLTLFFRFAVLSVALPEFMEHPRTVAEHR